MAQHSDGAYFQAVDSEQLAAAYRSIAELEPELYETTSFRPRYSIHYVPLAASMLLYMIYHVLAAFFSRQRRESAHVQ